MGDSTIGIRTNGSEHPAHPVRRAFSLISPVLAGFALAVPLAAISMHITFSPRIYALQTFLAGAAAAVLVLRLLVQRERRVALQLVMSEIVRENRSPEIAAERILEALCVSQGWDVALRWEVNAEEDRLEFCSAWSAPGRHTETLIQESVRLTLNSGEEMPGRVWQDGQPIWIANLASEPFTPHNEIAMSEGMVSGCAVPVRVGNTVLAVLEFYCHFCLRENREGMAAVETVAASLGQMLARSYERSRAEKLYRQQEILLDSVADGICGLDRNGLVSFANPAAARMLGEEPSSLIGKPVHGLLHAVAPNISQCFEEDCALLRAIEQQQETPTCSEDTFYCADGSSLRVDYTLTRILDQGHLSGSVLSFRDISQRHALDRLKNEFISTVSHELRTPLTAIRGALGLLSLEGQVQVSEKTTNLVRIAVANSDRLVRLINDILDLDRLGSGRGRVAFRPVQLCQIVRQAIDNMAPVADAALVQLIQDYNQVEVVADPDRLLQVLTNLISNAIKFSLINSAVSILTHTDIRGVTLSVIDSGRGIPADKLEVIFGRFQQVDATDSRQKGGTGLGLAICREIVQQHSGRIWAERNPVRGSTFRVFLPYKPIPIETPTLHFGQETCRAAVLEHEPTSNYNLS
jgi:PAS domain S-box-containing protein